MIICNYKTGYKIFLKIISVATFLLCVYALIVNPLDYKSLLIIPITIACLYTWFYPDYAKVEITENEIIKYGIWRKNTIKYTDIFKLIVFSNYIVVESKSATIEITTDLTSQKEAIAFVLKKLEPVKESLKVINKTKESIVSNVATEIVLSKLLDSMFD